MSTVHWLGAGLSSAPGIRLLAAERPLVLWNRTLAKARDIANDLDVDVRELDFDILERSVEPNDILVSMLPGNFHCQIASIAVSRQAHFVSSSYLSPEMTAFDAQARDAGVCLVNEVGLDPGIDHLMAHALVDDYRNSAQFDASNELSFRSYCGGFPLIPNEFKYKFSWSPLGVLRALKTPARCLSEGVEQRVGRPWTAVSNYGARLPGGMEDFEAYPNRDSLPFIGQYEFDPNWTVRDFVRGTLRLNGWTAAWKQLFSELDSLEGAIGDARLADISDELWERYAYAPGEKDRVVLCVELQADNGGTPVWHRGFAMDASGNERGSAMARLVSYTVAIAVDSIAKGDLAPGVSAAPTQPALVAKWLARLNSLDETVTPINYLS